MMLSHVTKWGNSLGVRIPQPMARHLKLHAGEPIEITLADDHLLITKPKYSLATLLQDVTPENIHAEVDFGKPKGKEIW